MRRRRWSSTPLLAGCLLAATAGCKEKQETTAATNAVAAVVVPATPPVHAAVARAPGTPVAAGVTPESARAIEGSCSKICAHSMALHCAHPEDCTPNCLAMAIGTPCAGEFGAFYRCLENEPAAHWECAEDGIAGVRESYCEREQEAAVGCMEAKAR